MKEISFADWTKVQQVKDGQRMTLRYDIAQVAVNEPTADVSGRKPVGPLDQFTGPWQPGDRRPTGEEQMIYKPQGWFDNLPDTTSGTDEPAPKDGSERSLSFTLNGVVPMPYSAAEQFRYLVQNCVVGKCTFDLGVVPPGAVGVASIKVSAVGDRDCSGRFAVGRNPAILVGDEVIQTLAGNTADLQFPVGGEVTGYGRAFRPGDHMYLICDFDKVSPEIYVQVAGHRRGT